jgi:hypothetical protein
MWRNWNNIYVVLVEICIVMEKNNLEVFQNGKGILYELAVSLLSINPRDSRGHYQQSFFFEVIKKMS